MNERVLKRLEYDKVLENLAGYCCTPLGRERVFALRPSVSAEEIIKAQAETTEGRKLLRLEPLAPTGGYSDVRQQAERASHGAVLEPPDLLSVGHTLAACRQIKDFLTARLETYPLLGEIGARLDYYNTIEKNIFTAILPGAEVSDSASGALGAIRRKLARTRSSVKEQLEKLTRSAAFQKYLQDPIVTIREDRYVVPVKLEYRSQVRGIVHDLSSSGATVFIEPMAVIEANNEIRRLQAEEKEEIIKILRGLSGQVGAAAGSIRLSLDELGHLEFIMAKARYSRDLCAEEPLLGQNPAYFILKKARHPLLSGDVTPNDLVLGRSYNILVITGPNTGGKTVALKTAGLLILMAQSGLHIPAGETTELGIFEQVFADIGDEQSIEQNLSTFSSHLNNIIHILSNASPSSLVLIDELGAGTDPAEGAALAQATLERLKDTGARVMVTTHSSELKTFARGRPGVENASLEFDAVTLRPTYRLLTGKPGHSNAFEIALRLGMEQNIVERARDFLTKEQLEMADLIKDLERSRQEIEGEREEAGRLLNEAREARLRYEKMEEDLLSQRQSMIEKAREEAGRIVLKMQKEAEETIRAFREQMAGESAREREIAILEVRKKIQAIKPGNSRQAPVSQNQEQSPDWYTVGQEVFVPMFNMRGLITAPVEENSVQVQVGAVKLSLPLKELRPAEKETASAGQVHAGGTLIDKARAISSQLDLRGKRAEEALLEVDKYLDDAGLAGLARIFLIHGKGTGALRIAVQQYLKADPRVKSFRLGEHGEGGLGVTVVDLA
ncbi:MAG: MutS2 protein [Desulfotomaculum sp. 46_296]|nr:MAG: MutS2 protein [Desulfotomaculum sp. 46_296]HAU32202.1 endonuclease MutS2 [Desulfotomaculum sp.]